MTERVLLRQRLSAVENTTGSGTALISLYIPAESSLQSSRRRMAEEQSEAANIKSDSNRKNVKKSLSRVERILRRYDQTPENGLVIFTGVTDGDDKVEFVFDDLDAPLNYSDYKCDNTFHTQKLRDQLQPDNTLGLLVIERGGMSIGELRGSEVIHHRSDQSSVMGKHRAGGQCLVPETTVYRADGSPVSLMNIESGDTIVGVDLQDNSLQKTTVTDKWTETKPIVCVICDETDGLYGSPDHTAFVRTSETAETTETVETTDTAVEQPFSEITAGTEILRVENPRVQRFMHGQTVRLNQTTAVSTKTVSSVSSLDSRDVIDISTTAGNFVANQFVVHNSAERFDALIEEQKASFFEEVSNDLTSRFVDTDNQPTVDGFVTGGTNMTVDDFVSNGYLPPALNDVRIGGAFSVDIASGERALEQLVSRSRDQIDKFSSQEERELTDRFFQGLKADDIHVTYGTDNIDTALEQGAVKTLLVSDKASADEIIERKETVENQGGKLVTVSTEFEQGQRLWQAFDGTAAILRYSLDWLL